MTVEQNDSQWNSYWLARARHYKKEMLLSGKTGLFQWTINANGERERFRNVVEHELVEAEVVDVLGELMKLSNGQRHMLQQAAMVHDIWKRHQIESINQAPEENKEKVQDQAFANQDQFLRTSRIPHGVIRLIQSTGHDSLPQFVDDPTVRPFQLRQSVTVPMAIMRYADLIISGSSITNIDERIAALDNRQPPYPEKDKGRDIFGGRTYYQAAAEISHLIENDLVSTLLARNAVWSEEWQGKLQQDSSQLPHFIQAVIDKRIADFHPTGDLA